MASRAGAVRLDAALDARAAFATHSAGRLVPNDVVGVSRTVTQQGPTLMAEHAAHPSATALLAATTEGVHLDGGRRDQLGRSFVTVESIRETLAGADKRRMDIALTGDAQHRERGCLLCSGIPVTRGRGRRTHHRAHFYVGVIF